MHGYTTYFIIKYKIENYFDIILLACNICINTINVLYSKLG